jgi:hypothetical protein
VLVLVLEVVGAFVEGDADVDQIDPGSLPVVLSEVGEDGVEADVEADIGSGMLELED